MNSHNNTTESKTIKAPLALNNVYFNLKKSTQLQLIDQSIHPLQQLTVSSHSAELTYALNIMAQIDPPTNSLVTGKGIQVLPEYLFVKQLVEQNFPAIFLTGGAGTGKSTFI
ncbi:hypothetical protein RJJ65_34870, partial [Rhizobium hidalgonense]